jgi:hypothetical protein
LSRGSSQSNPLYSKPAGIPFADIPCDSSKALGQTGSIVYETSRWDLFHRSLIEFPAACAIRPEQQSEQLAISICECLTVDIHFRNSHGATPSFAVRLISSDAITATFYRKKTP